MSVASTISPPKNSFVSLTDYGSPDCNTGETFCLPMYDRANTKFQMFVTEFSDNPVPEDANTRSFYAIYIPIGACPESYPFNVTGALDSSNSKKLGVAYEFIAPVALPAQPSIVGLINFTGDTGDTIEIIYDGQPYDIGGCFRLAIVERWTAEDSEDIISEYIIACSNCFVKIANSCFLSMLLYGNNENTQGFIYDVNGLTAGSGYQLFKNRIELPMYLRSPELPSEESTYMRSDGSYRKLSERTDEQLTLETDNVPYLIHKRLKVALGSDILTIMNSFLAGKEGNDYVCTEALEIVEDFVADVPVDWNKATTKVKAKVPVSLINSNCV